ncbi:MAG TPA: hypothetical protein H9763_12025 [Candidatus Eisenbergiella merdigallinarum]|uniref:FMN-binding domain-containing protein n=1 Tax=Candidatus Eisenbergiella merdigallinarum TaxID=2838552 RepID=A0A9D2MUC9_9FIRM|nr:hypothetical protein [Candidatus Eisenbergiella merdigallinarum]
MSSKTKIIVLHLKELIYTGIFILLAVLFLILMALMFLPGKKGEKPVFSDDVVRYVPGKYTTSLQIGSAGVDVEVVVDDSCITSIRLINLSEAVTTMYPLMEPCLESISDQVLENQSLEGITWPEENQYTSQLLLEAISAALQKAAVAEEETGSAP